MDPFADEEGQASSNSHPGPTIDQLQSAYEAVTHSDLVQEDYELAAQTASMTATGGVKLALQTISTQLGVNLEPGWKDFQVVRYKHDPRDVIDPK